MQRIRISCKQDRTSLSPSYLVDMPMHPSGEDSAGVSQTKSPTESPVGTASDSSTDAPADARQTDADSAEVESHHLTAVQDLLFERPPGTYPIKIHYKGATYTHTVVVPKDTEAPYTSSDATSRNIADQDASQSDTAKPPTKPASATPAEQSANHTPAGVAQAEQVILVRKNPKLWAAQLGFFLLLAGLLVITKLIPSRGVLNVATVVLVTGVAVLLVAKKKLAPLVIIPQKPAQ